MLLYDLLLGYGGGWGVPSDPWGWAAAGRAPPCVWYCCAAAVCCCCCCVLLLLQETASSVPCLGERETRVRGLLQVGICGV